MDILEWGSILAKFPKKIWPKKKGLLDLTLIHPKMAKF